jgi:hypothetical protein
MMAVHNDLLSLTTQIGGTVFNVTSLTPIQAAQPLLIDAQVQSRLAIGIDSLTTSYVAINGLCNGCDVGSPVVRPGGRPFAFTLLLSLRSLLTPAHVPVYSQIT